MFNGDYLFVYDYDDNHVVVLIKTTPDGADTLDFDIEDEELADTMGYDMLEVMESKNCKICDDSDSIYGELHEMDDDTYSLYDALG